jgi:FAD/FMN-containing dehydrogenase
MSKIAKYLNEHILGEITGAKAVRERFSRDRSVLSIKPELVMFPRVTNDIRKAARFSWQLAEKGHVLPLTVRGAGSDETGAAIGKGLIINTTAHLNNIIYLALKDKDHFVHVQPGVTFKALNDTLNWHGLAVPTYPASAAFSTIGGAVASNTGGQFSGKAGLTGDWVQRLEVVLANGDLIETTRLRKHEVSKKIGLQTFEGEIYRKLDGLIEDNQVLINEKLSGSTVDNTGYARISQVKQKDGSFDLTPLMVGNQGTLGIISEIVLKTDYISKDIAALAAVVSSSEVARDAVDALKKLDSDSLEIIDGQLFDQARESGKSYPFFSSTDSDDAIGAVIYAQFNDFSEHAREHKIKKAQKILKPYNATIVTTDDHTLDELQAIREVASTIHASDNGLDAYPPLIDGASIPTDRREEFSMAVMELASKHHVKLPLHTRVLDGVVYTRPALQLDKVSDKQKVFKIISEYAQLVDKFGGTFLADSSEGRLKANAAYSIIDEDVQQLYEQIRVIFDPFGTLNPGVKQPSDIKSLVEALRSSYDAADFM